MIKMFVISVCLVFACLNCGKSLTKSSSNTPHVVKIYDLVVLEPVRLDRPPMFKFFSPPMYPRLAEQAGIEGIVWLKGFVNINGKLTDVSVYTSSGTEALDDAAIYAAEKCTLIPGRREMRPVPVWVKYKVEFILDY